MKKKFSALGIIFFALNLLICSVNVPAISTQVGSENYLNIVTPESSNLYVDKLLLLAFKNVEYNVEFTPTTNPNGFVMANSGERDGVITSIPNIQQTYTNLAKIPTPLEQTHIYAYVKENSDLSVNSWDELEGLSVCILEQRPYIEGRIPESAVITKKETTNAAMEGILSGEYDVAVLSMRSHGGINIIEGVKTSGRIDVLTDYLYLNKKKYYLVNRLVTSINNIFKTGVGDQILSGTSVPEINSKKTILHIVSNNTEVEREKTFVNSLRDQFINDDSLEWYTVALSNKRFSLDPNRLVEYAQLLRQYCITRNVEAIVVSSDEAVKFVKEYYYQLFNNVPVLVYGVVDGPSAKTVLQFQPHFSGIVDHISALETVSIARSLFPDTNNIFVINDYTTEGVNYRNAIQKQLNNLDINVAFNDDVDFQVLLEQIDALPKNSIVLAGSYFSDTSGQYQSNNDMIRALKNSCSVPVFTLYSTGSEYNAIGGKRLDYKQHGIYIADLLKQLLSGADPASMSFTSSVNDNRWVFDKNLLNEFGISERALPANCEVLNKTPSVWETDPKFAYSMIATVVMGIITTIGLSLFIFKLRAQKERLVLAEELLAKDAKIKEVKERLERIINTAPLAYMMTLDGVVVETNEYVKEFFGTKEGEPIINYYSEPSVREELIKRSLNLGEIKNEIVRFNTVDGGNRRYLINIATTEHGSKQALILWATDMEDYELQKDSLSHSKKEIKEVSDRLERIIDTAPVLYLITIGEEIVGINENMKECTGLDVGDNVRNFYADPDMHDVYAARVRDEGVIKNDRIKVLFKGGKQHRCALSLATTDYNEHKAVVVWAFDVENSETQKDQLKIVQHSLQTVLDAMPAPLGILDSETSELLYCNKAFLRFFSYESLDSIGINVESVYCVISPGQNRIMTIPEASVYLTSPICPQEAEMQCFTSNGAIVDIRIKKSSIIYNGKEAIVGIVTDLARENEFKRAQQNLQMILDLLPIPVVITDFNNGVVMYANNDMSRLFGFSSFSMVTNPFVYEYLPEFQPDGIPSMQKWDILKQEYSESTEIQCLKADGTPVDVLVTAIRIDYQGKRASLGIIKDLTAEKEYKHMLLRTAQKEKEANQLKSRFLVNMSHEIRTPMNAIIGLTEIELKKELPNETRTVYRKINSSALNLLNIINDILDLSKIEADKIELYNDVFELEDAVSNALLVATPRLDGKNVEFMLDTTLDLPRFVIGDRTRLWQILKNFLDNSAKYTDEGKIVLTVREDTGKSDSERIFIKFCIDDTGIGIDEDQLQKLFLPYTQIYNEAQKRYTGTGLGMVIAKQLCELMGGHMEIESTLGKGTSVEILIPFRRAESMETGIDAFYAPSIEGSNILVVDDDEHSLSIMYTLLKKCNANCELARDGEEAISIILNNRDKGKAFNLILLDYMMDGINGLETARRIQTSLSIAPKLLMVTACQRQLLENELAKNNITELIEKPFIPSQFITKIQAVLENGVYVETLDDDSDKFIRFSDVNVLLCEDYEINQEVATGMLAHFGIKPTIAENGKVGVELLYSGIRFDLVFMDLQMPVMDGYEAVSEIRKDKRFDKLPIISMTADAMKEVADKCLEIGMNDCLAKPISFKGLHNMLVKWLPKSKQDLSGTEPISKKNTLDDGLARFGGNKEKFEKALKEFAKSLPDKWQTFDECLSNAEETCKYLHKIKGAAGNLSLNDIFEGSAKLEIALKNKVNDPTLYDTFMAACNTFKNSYKDTPESIIEESEIVGTLQEMKEKLNLLKDALADYDLKRSTDIADELKVKRWPINDDKRLIQLYDYLGNYDFEAALDELELLLLEEWR